MAQISTTMTDSPENVNPNETLTNNTKKDTSKKETDDHIIEVSTQIPPISSTTLPPKPVTAPATFSPLSASLTGISDVKDSTQSVVVALRIRPLTSSEHKQGCKDCITVIPNEPQIQLGSNFFTFDHVYGSTGSRTTDIFDECVAPLIDGLFQGYNATVLAYGQTGSGKTYTMGTAFTVGGGAEGITPRVMETLFKKIEKSKDGVESQLRVSFIEILKEEVHDLLDPNPAAMARADLNFLTVNCKNPSTGKPVIQIRETTNGEIMVAGVREVEVANHQEMALCLEQGALSRATGSTNMNATSSRSHAIFTVTLEQRKKLNMNSRDNNTAVDEIDDFLCAKLHLVDLAGSERAKRTGTDGLRFKEGVHINKGLLALGNVISALCDERKRKEGGHIPYRDSKLTRILQDSLGGNSRTVMIACVSPADVNAEETLNTLKYANRARNIQNKPVINRDPVAAEMQRLRQQLDLLQAELACARAVGSTALDAQRIAWLEASNAELQKELQDLQASYELVSKRVLESQVERDKLQLKIEYLKSGKPIDDLDENEEFGVIKSHLQRIQELEAKLQQLQKGQPNLNDNDVENSQCMELGATNAEPLKPRSLPNAVVFGDEEAETMAKEWEHNVRQDTLSRELQNLTKCLEQKEAEMRNFLKNDTTMLRHQFEKKLYELEEEKKALQKERDILLVEMENLVNISDEQTQKMKDMYAQKLKILEFQISELKRSQESQATILRQKQRSEEAAKHLQDEIHRMKAQRVNLMHKIKQENDAFRLWKASRERELYQLKKEGRKNEFEMKKLHMLNQRQKMVLQRKTEEAAAVTRRLKELLEVRKNAAKEGSSQGSSSSDGSLHINEKELQQWLSRELEVAVRIHEVRTAYEKQSDARASIAKELEELKMEEELNRSEDDTSEIRKSEFTSTAEMARKHRISLLDSLLSASSTALVNMAAELSDAEERERSTTTWPNFQNIAQAKQLLQLTFNAAATARCQLHEMELENCELNNKITGLNELLKHKDVFRREVESGHRLREPSVSMALLTSDKGSDITRDVEELSIELSRISQARVSSRLGSSSDCSYFKSSRVSAFPENLDKVVSTGHGACMKQDSKKARPWKWKWNQQWWMLHLRWWQKPWLFPEWMKHTEKSHSRIRSGSGDIGHLL
uniref:Kinesin 4-Ib protein n=1 Tax=Marsilea vestita TaxID=59764 RepID=A0A142KW91_MARVE|nr:kinesin 4-Ib protein [Marsilea vestita]